MKTGKSSFMPGCAGCREVFPLFPFRTWRGNGSEGPDLGQRLWRLTAVIICAVGMLCQAPPASAAEERKREDAGTSARYSFTMAIPGKAFRFADEDIPLKRPDVAARVDAQINFLLMDARSVLTLWLQDLNRYKWLFRDVLVKEGLPKDFVLLAAVISGLTPKVGSKSAGVGWWAIDKPCTEADGVPMTTNAWIDDRLDFELSTACFAKRLKKTRDDLKTKSNLMAAAAYIASRKDLVELQEKWKTKVFWDLPLPDDAEVLVTRWVALGIIYKYPKSFDLNFKESQPVSFDQVSNLKLAKDLPVAEIARITKTPPILILEMNPKIKPNEGKLPAMVGGKPVEHSLAAPKGTGKSLVEHLKKEGFLAVKR
ncbi:MAG: hypothetical protein V2B18_06895 [Pseudomonadota bacterium]